MDETFISNDQYPSSPMSDQHSTATISEKVVDVSNIGTFVMGEHNSSMITFQIDRYYDGVDLSDKKIKIVYKNSNGIYESDDAEICNVKYSQKSLRFSWIVSSNVTQTSKFVAYVCFISDDYLMKTENFTVLVKSSFDPATSEPSANWFVTIEGKLEKIEKDIADNHVYDWAKQPEKPTYTPEEIGAEKAGTSDGIFRSAMKYTDGEISRLEDTVIPDNVATLEQKITDLNQSVVSLQDAKAEKVHTHLVANITDFPTSLPASDVYDWAKAETKPTYTHDEVGALSSSTHIPSTLEEMTDDQNHRTVSDVEKKTWNAKSEFSGSYNDLTDVPEIKQLTDDLKAKYDNAATLATTNKNTLDTHAIQTKELLEGLKNGYVEYQLTWIENEEVVSTGKFISQDGWKRTTYVDICDAEKIFVPSSFSVDDLPDSFLYTAVWFDENHKSIEDMSLEEMLLVYTVPPTNAKYFVISYSPMSLNIPIAKICELKEGFRTTASGQYSHAEGDGSVASGNSSHAEGHTSATGECSHAEGINSHANGRASHAEGINTLSEGASSHAEGCDTEAKGKYSHAEGCNTKATGNQSHAEGYGTTASKVSSHAEGDSTNASGDNSHAEGKKSTASGAQSHAEGISTRASGEDSHAEGSSTIASQMCAHAEGGNTQAIASVAHAEGGNTIASGMAAHAEGNQTTASGPSSHSEGMSTSASGEQSHAEGVGTKAIGNYAHAEGAGSIAQNMASHAEGTNTKALGMYSHAEGYLSEARNDYAHAEGCETIAIDYAHAEGNKSQASGKYSHAEGNTTTASSDYAHAEGNGSTASGECAHAEGDGATASGNYSHAEGINTLSKGMCSHVEGASTTASGGCSHAEGSTTHAEGELSHAEGTNSHAVGSVSHAEGTNTLAEGESSHAEGSNTEAKGKYSHASGFCTQATHSCQYAVGCGNDPQADSLFEVGNGLNAEGNLIDDTTTLFDLKTRRNAFRVTNTGYAIAQTALQIGETAITEDQLKQLIQLITNAG